MALIEILRDGRNTANASPDAVHDAYYDTREDIETHDSRYDNTVPIAADYYTSGN